MPESASRPKVTVSIYQNPEHVSGILQQLYREPLLIAGTRESHSEKAHSEGGTEGGGINAGFDLKIPGVGGLSAGATLDDSASFDSKTAAGMRSTQNFVYSQAYYLYVVLERLQATGMLKAVSSLNDAEDLSVGDFVEFEATFKANEVTTILDVLTPELVAEIVRYRIKREGRDYFDVYEDFEERKRKIEQLHSRAEYSSDLAAAVMRAIRVDFRSDKTREFYGTISTGSEPLTAVVSCDREHFVVSDEDRILDGNFTVLGKVISPTERDVPILARNKILDRVRPAAVDALAETLSESVESSSAAGRQKLFKGLSPAEMFDLEFSPRIVGVSFRVIPVAIYS